MTIAEFLEHFSKTTGWVIVRSKWIPDRGSIRSPDRCLCPLTCVAQRVFGRPYFLWFALNAGQELGLSQADAQTIMNAADDVPGADQNLRKELLKSVM